MPCEFCVLECSPGSGFCPPSLTSKLAPSQLDHCACGPGAGRRQRAGPDRSGREPHPARAPGPPCDFGVQCVVLPGTPKSAHMPAVVVLHILCGVLTLKGIRAGWSGRCRRIGRRRPAPGCRGCWSRRPGRRWRRSARRRCWQPSMQDCHSDGTPPPVPLVGVSIHVALTRGCKQKDSLADG